MASEEDRLDQLLKAAQQQMAGIAQGQSKKTATVPPKVGNTTETTGIAEEESAAPASFDVPEALQDAIFSESAPDTANDPDLFGEEYQPSTENFPMKIFDEIPEEIYRKTIMADDPEEESPAESVTPDAADESGMPEFPEEDETVVNASPFAGTETIPPAADDDPNKMMSPDDIAALVASMSRGDDAPAEEDSGEELPEFPEADAPVVNASPFAGAETASSATDDDPNKMMSPDDIAALVASMSGGDDTPAEEDATAEETAGDEPVEETPAPAADDDPNKMMSPDDIAALVASMSGGENTPAEEGPEEDAPVEEAAPVIDDDPNKVMSPDDIAALVASMAGGEESPVEEETVSLNENTGSDEDDPYKSMSQEEINALMGMDGVDGTNASGENGESEPYAEAAVSDDIGDLLDGGLDLENAPSGNTDTDEMQNMGIEDIEEQLRLAAQIDESPDPLDDDTDVVSILQEMGESDPDLSDLGDYLQKSDNNELLDNSILEQMENAGKEAEEETDGEEESDKKKAKKKKKEKEKGEGGLFGLFKKKKQTEKGAENGETAKEKKPGFFARLLQTLTEEPEEDEEVPEGKQTKLSGENEAILKEIDAESEDPKGKKKKKKEKKAKPKKEKAEKPKKEKKPKKPKKEKPEEPDNSKKIPKKYIVRTFMLSLSILAAILLLSMYVPSLLVLKQARKAYYDADYKTAFLQMYGKDLSESDRLIYERSRLLVTLSRKYESYENYRKMGMRAEALDALLQGVKRYEDLKDEAKELDVAPEFAEIYFKIVSALNGDFDMTEEEARETLTYSAFDYTGKIEAAANGLPYRLMQDEVNETILQPVLEDLLKNPPQPVPEVPQDENTADEVPVTDSNLQLPDLLPEEQQYLEQGVTEEGAQDDSVILEIPVQPNNTAIGNATSNDANIDLQIESGQF